MVFHDLPTNSLPYLCISPAPNVITMSPASSLSFIVFIKSLQEVTFSVFIKSHSEEFVVFIKLVQKHDPVLPVLLKYMVYTHHLCMISMVFVHA